MIVVLADDFSGAAEAAGIAYQYGLSVLLQTDFQPCNVDCLVIDTNTRSLSPQEAELKVLAVAKSIRQCNPTFVYKKVDSLLRGPVAAEVAALARAFDRKRVLIVNANPSHGRIVVEGSLQIYGVPVDQTQFALDPEHPRNNHSISELLRCSEYIGLPIEIANASSLNDLAELATNSAPDSLLCGAADFFATLLRERFGLQVSRPYTELHYERGTIIACGSSTGSLRTLVASSQNSISIVDVASSDLTVDTLSAQLNAGLFIGVMASGADEWPSHDRRMEAIADAIASQVDRGMVSQLLVEGGRTASSIAAALAWKQFHVVACYAAGVVGLAPIEHPSKRVVVKPGSYTWPSLSAPHLPLQNLARASATALILGLVVLLSTMTLATAADFENRILPLLETHCIACHGMPDDSPEAGFSIAKFRERETILEHRPEWKRILDLLESFEMPPADDNLLASSERQALIEWIRSVLAEPEPNGHIRAGPPTFRRLTRLEYNNTVRDLLGLVSDVFMFSERLPFDKSYFQPELGTMPASLSVAAREYGSKYPVLLPAAGLPADSRATNGFSNRGDAQDFSSSQLEQYIGLAEQIAFHPDLLSVSERMQEIFPGAQFQQPSSVEPTSSQPVQIINTVSTIAPHGNIVKTAPGSKFSLEEFQLRVARAFSEDRGGVLDISQNINSTLAGKGGVMQLAFGTNARHLFGINPSEDMWSVVFSSGAASSGNAILTNKVKDKKQFLLGFHASSDSDWKGIRELGLVLLSRQGQSGSIDVSVTHDDGSSATVTVRLNEGRGTDNTFVSFAAPTSRTIKRLNIDGSQFSGPYVLLDDIAFIADIDTPAAPQLVGIEPPQLNEGKLIKERSETNNSKSPLQINRSIASLSPRERLTHFMTRAFRRDVSAEEIDLYLELYHASMAEQADDELAMRRAIHGILSSPSFLYLQFAGEHTELASVSPAGGDSGRPPVRLTDNELASRLSYFLWSSPPDDELVTIAAAGRLRDPEILEHQVARMLRDSRVRELGENFFVEWMRLRELWSVQPDRNLFAEYYDGPSGKQTLADDMFIESLLQFETVLVENRSILEWIDSDYTYLNAELAEIYGLEGPATGWQRVRLTDARRGGLLTGAAMLTLTSYPHRTSLIRRGNWFLEAIMNRPPPPPKIAVAEIDEQVHAEELTLREKVELHRANSACAVCHDRIDPPGFALESYDAIGRWRTQDGEELIDSSGTLPGLGTFSDAPELKRLIWDQREHFVRGFTEHLLSYALSRRLEYFDVAAIERIVQAASEDDYALGSIIIEIVNSYPFQYVDRQ